MSFILQISINMKRLQGKFNQMGQKASKQLIYLWDLMCDACVESIYATSRNETTLCNKLSNASIYLSWSNHDIYILFSTHVV